jgi:NADH-quinone oxidoreductase subunit J
MEILIYVGAISISFVFAIMLSEPMYKEKSKRNVFKTVFTGIVAGLIFWSFSTIITKTPWEAAAVKSDEWSVRAIGNLLLTRYMLAFELISFVLLVAIIGAVIIAGQGRRQRSSQ